LERQPAPTFKERNAVEREVTRLLDELAPERANPRATRVAAAIEQHRSPNGCILQAENAALSVTWYREATDQDRVGELQIMLWSGVVSRRGAQSRTPATVVTQEVLNPIEYSTDDAVWVAGDGKRYSTAALIAHCLEMLERQMGA
jgi:hypothetical protein